MHEQDSPLVEWSDIKLLLVSARIEWSPTVNQLRKIGIEVSAKDIEFCPSVWLRRRAARTLSPLSAGYSNPFDPSVKASAEQRAERYAVCITDACGDFVYGGSCCLQQVDRPLHAHTLEVLQRRPSKNCIKATSQSPFTGSNCLCSIV